MAHPVQRFPPNTTVRLNDSVIAGYDLTIHGDRNTITARYSTVNGSGNHINGSSLQVTGNNNNITSNYATVNETHNSINGSSPEVRGNVNRVTAEIRTLSMEAARKSKGMAITSLGIMQK